MVYYFSYWYDLFSSCILFFSYWFYYSSFDFYCCIFTYFLFYFYFYSSSFALWDLNYFSFFYNYYFKLFICLSYFSTDTFVKFYLYYSDCLLYCFILSYISCNFFSLSRIISSIFETYITSFSLILVYFYEIFFKNYSHCIYKYLISSAWLPISCILWLTCIFNWVSRISPSIRILYSLNLAWISIFSLISCSFYLSKS